MADFPRPIEGILLTHLVETSDVARSRRFYAEVLGGEVLLDGHPTISAIHFTGVAQVLVCPLPSPAVPGGPSAVVTPGRNAARPAD
jgi:hypothetical protein